MEQGGEEGGGLVMEDFEGDLSWDRDDVITGAGESRRPAEL